MAWFRDGVAVGCVLVVTISCGPSSPADGDSSSTAGAETGDSSSTGVDATGSAGADASTTCAAGDDDGASIEETHVVILADCGLALSCDPIRLHVESPVGECADELWATGQPGLLRVDYDEGDGILFQEAFLLMADRRVVRQSRGRVGSSADACGDPEWAAWGPHEICDVGGGFEPEGGVLGCDEVPDFTCAELVELYEAEPLPPVPCEERSEADCAGPLDADTDCVWSPDYTTHVTDSCEPVGAPGRCVTSLNGPQPECVLPPVCDGVRADAVQFRENADATVDITTIYGCWLYEGFQRCAWNGAGELVVGPPACDCACR